MKKSVWVGSAIVVLGAIVVGVCCSKHTPPSSFVEHSELTLPVHELKLEDFNYVESYIGSVQAIQSVGVVPYLSGFLEKVLVQSGEEVERGQTLFVLDERIPLADLNQAKESVQQASATRANAEAFYQRMNKTEAKAISSTELEDAKTQFQAADAAYQRAIAAQNQAQTLYDYTKITAPISGWVGNITATVGEYLSPAGQVLATIISFSPIRLVFSIPMSVYHQQESFDRGILQVVLSNGKIVEFTQFHIAQDNRADTATDSVSFFIDVPNVNKQFVPGAYIEIRFVFHERGILVDKSWISLTPDGSEAVVLNDGVIEKRSVVIKAPVGNRYWIVDGLNEGDQIITTPVSSNHIGSLAKGIPK